MNRTKIETPLTAGLCEAASIDGIGIYRAPDGIYADDPAKAEAFANDYSGSAAELTYWRSIWKARLDAMFDKHFDLAQFVRDGTVTTITGTQVGNFLASVTNNYRSLRSQISSAATVAAVKAIDITSGWPNNP